MVRSPSDCRRRRLVPAGFERSLSLVSEHHDVGGGAVHVVASAAVNAAPSLPFSHYETGDSPIFMASLMALRDAFGALSIETKR